MAFPCLMKYIESNCSLSRERETEIERDCGYICLISLGACDLQNMVISLFHGVCLLGPSVTYFLSMAFFPQNILVQPNFGDYLHKENWEMKTWWKGPFVIRQKHYF